MTDSAKRRTRDELEHVISVEEFPTQDDALAAAMERASPGDRIEIHAEACGIDRGERCSCDPLTCVMPRTRTV